MPFLLDIQNHEAEIARRIAAHAVQTLCPDFADLWWDPMDLDSVLSDPGVKFETDSRMFVVARINGELRYFAGGKDIYDEDYDYELGVFDTLSHALEFGEAYLSEGSDLRNIECERSIREARLAAKPGSGIARRRGMMTASPSGAKAVTTSTGREIA